ncbi:MAG: Leader peptidase (Prepilin peptidase) (EC / N-methyltransferase (EC [uncultured Campylobacterales bacterium]|uniref:Leader peptidase (Prepilin peptidase) ) n=1 Tax=uncultured Campylobacterales bacterium TaxID=352960 RepID=A0A6S6T8K0_9BACT|nr:MAG: Leader peptidase (Prepilin peptidase) (EC / N-methyltransferase (EC [uncultured Campylobacterales bacterium]
MDFNIIFVALFGASFGSFMNVLIYRIPNGVSMLEPYSSCPSCKNNLKFYHNIPILSYIFLRASCGFCKSKISFVYPLVELAGIVLFCFLYIKTDDFMSTLIMGNMFLLLLGLSIIDFRFKAVPDSMNLLALLLAVFSYGTELLVFNLINALLFIGGFCLLRFIVSYFKKQESMGEADIIIAGTIGAVLGVKLGLVAIVLSSVLALIAFVFVAKKDYELPYVPFLSLAMLLVYIYQKQFLILIEYLYA